MKTKDAVDALQGIPPSLASKARQYLGGIVHYAIREGLREDGRLLSLRGAISSHRTVHIPAATSPSDVRKVALAVHSYGVPVTRIALQIAMLTAQRPGEVVSMEWNEVDLENAEWRIPADKMKMRHSAHCPAGLTSGRHCCGKCKRTQAESNTSSLPSLANRPNISTETRFQMHCAEWA